MVLEEVEVSQITKTFLFSNSFVLGLSSTFHIFCFWSVDGLGGSRSFSDYQNILIF